MKKIIVMLIVLTIGVSGCAKVEKKQPQEAPPFQGGLVLGEVESPSIINIPERIQDYIDQMTADEKIGQLLMPAFRSYEYGDDVDQLSQSIEKVLEVYNVGGLILFKENIRDKDQVQTLIKDLQKSSKIPLWIGVDEEGGGVSRISSNPAMGFDQFPSAFDIKDTEEAYELGKSLGIMLKELGFNMNFAPVADIWSNPNNTVIGRRSFGDDPSQVSQMVRASVKGLQEQEIVSVVKHFPGHGDTGEDTHVGRAFVDRSLDELFQRELIPFQKAMDQEVAGVMVAHLELPQIDQGVPASLSYKIITELLKDKIGFKGLIITDALDMEAITAQFGKGEAALKSFMAGSDILLMPDVKEAYDHLLKAYQDEIITDERLGESLYKILYVKYQYGIIDEDFLT